MPSSLKVSLVIIEHWAKVALLSVYVHDVSMECSISEAVLFMTTERLGCVYVFAVLKLHRCKVFATVFNILCIISRCMCVCICILL